MADIGYRLKGDSGPMYNPERDYAYITPTLMRQAIEKLDANDDVDQARWRAEQRITEEEVVAVAEALAAAQRDFVNAADPVTGFEAALNRHNFFNFRYCVRQYLWSAIGEVFAPRGLRLSEKCLSLGKNLLPRQTWLVLLRPCASLRTRTNRQRTTLTLWRSICGC